ncbi:anti-sigma factor [Paraglaciecola sp. 20A4]|uniref:anti-sigma factor n=1 Tax=Paraglaciecola sp. 20A4 TaxID=2687288 RepID=UPI00140A93F9|nr:anti-sigma factor [Paraglaciecola sp. 20A4]
MNYLNPELYNALAAQYVLGTLRGPARRRFSRLMMEFSDISEAVNRWELYLNSLGEQLADVTPDEDVWHKIEQRLGFSQSSATGTVNPAQDDKHKQAEIIPLAPRKPRIWQSLAGLASAAALVLAVLLVQMELAPTPEVKQLAMFSNQQTDLLWSVEITDENIAVQATKALQAKLDADYELWIVPEDGSAPISLGLLPKSGALILAKPALFARINIAALAVSIEPLGGSPTGAPTEVLYTSKLVLL